MTCLEDVTLIISPFHRNGLRDVYRSRGLKGMHRKHRRHAIFDARMHRKYRTEVGVHAVMLSVRKYQVIWRLIYLLLRLFALQRLDGSHFTHGLVDLPLFAWDDVKQTKRNWQRVQKLYLAAQFSQFHPE